MHYVTFLNTLPAVFGSYFRNIRAIVRGSTKQSTSQLLPLPFRELSLPSFQQNDPTTKELYFLYVRARLST